MLGGVQPAAAPASNEDLTTYTEYDTGGYYTVTSARCTAASFPNNQDNALLYDFGADHFNGDFEIWFDLYMTSISADGFYLGVIALTADTTDYTIADLYSGTTLTAWVETTSGTPNIRIRRQPGDFTTTNIGLSTSTAYYGKIYRSSLTHGIAIWTSASGRTAGGATDRVGVQTFDTGVASSYRGLVVMPGDDTGAGGKTGSWYVENVEIKSP